jgi:prevent-host-death family protein
MPDGDSFGDAREVQASEVRQSFSDFVDECWRRGRRTVIKRNGKPVAALVSIADLHSLLESDEQQGKALLGEIGETEAAEQATAPVVAPEREKEMLHGAANEVIAIATRMIVPIAVKAAEEAIRNNRSRRERGTVDESAIAERVIAEIETMP